MVGRGLGGVHAGFEAEDEVGGLTGGEGGEEGAGAGGEGVVEEVDLGFWSQNKIISMVRVAMGVGRGRSG